MKSTTIYIENLKCHGCANTITKGLNKMQEVNKVDVDVANSSVAITFDVQDESLVNIKKRLAKLGYPEMGNNNALLITKSFVSCAVGRVTK